MSPKNKKKKTGVIDDARSGDSAQEEAISHGSGPLLVVAGAGTGKTRVITKRIARLINDKTAEPSDILALTFSEKAAREMERRVDELVPYGMVDTHISTFHSFGKKVIDECFADLRIAPDWRIITEPDAIIMITGDMERFGLKLYRPLNNPSRYIGELMGFISKLKDNLVTAGEYVKFAEEKKEAAKSEEEKEEAEKHIELARFYSVYEEVKQENNCFDYGDLILVPYFLFKNKKTVIKRYRGRYKYILIDEFQDTNYAQFELVKLLAEKHANITAVGDDDQMIYRFRGAAISNIMGFREYYRGAKVVVLKNNYRSAQLILDASYRLIKNNIDRLENSLNIDKKLVSKYTPAHKIKHVNVRLFNNYTMEADFLVAEIERLVKAGYYDYKDFCVLSRANNDARVFVKSLECKGIPYTFTGDEGLFNRRDVLFLVNYCRVIAAPYDFNPLFDVAISQIYSINPFVMSKIGHRAKEYSITAIDMLKQVETYPELEIPEEDRKKLDTLAGDIDYYTNLVAEGWNAGEIMLDFLKKKNIFSSLLKEQSVESQKRIGDISGFFSIYKQFSVIEEYDNVVNFIEYVDMKQKAGENPKNDTLDEVEENAVQVSSVHRAKGLEFPVVFIVAAVQDKFPARARSRTSFPLPEDIMKDLVDEKQYMSEEERRLFYVAMTRAKDALYITASKKYEGVSERKISVFLREIGFRLPGEFENYESVNDRLAHFERKKKQMNLPVLSAESGPVTLSNYQIDDYLTCPFKYMLAHVYKLPIERGTYRVMYGQAVHKAIAEYFRAKTEGKEISEKDMLSVFEAMWSPVGFTSREHEKERLERGREAVKEFFRAQEKEGQMPAYIEKSFEFKLSPKLVIRGRWDRIDEQGGKAIIIDYKTSEAKDIKEAKKKINSQDIARQLKLYTIAYREVFKKPVDKVGIYFFESNILATKSIKEKTLENFKEDIFKVAEKISKKDFEATPGQHICKYCAFALHACPHSRADVIL